MSSSHSPVNEPFIPPSPSPPPEDSPPRLPAPAKPYQPYQTTYTRYGHYHTPYNPIGWHLSPPLPSHWNLWASTPAYHPQAQLHTPHLHVHRDLCYNATHPEAGPELLWDITHPPDYARVRHPQRGLWKKPDLDADAVQPSTRKVWIVSDHHVLAYWIKRWGHITVNSDDKVTVGAVLQGIYTYLRTPLTPDDLHHAKNIPGYRDGLRLAREQRAKDSYEVTSVVMSVGYRRVDIVGGHRKFKGIRVQIFDDETWRLHFDLLPGPVSRIS